jgi:hypothetical protein
MQRLPLKQGRLRRISLLQHTLKNTQKQRMDINVCEPTRPENTSKGKNQGLHMLCSLVTAVIKVKFYYCFVVKQDSLFWQSSHKQKKEKERETSAKIGFILQSAPEFVALEPIYSSSAPSPPIRPASVLLN